MTCRLVLHYMSDDLDDGGSEAALDHLHELWEVTNDPDRPFETKLQDVFELGTEVFDLQYGLLSRIDRTTDTQTIEAAHGSHGQLQDGETAPLSESCCRHTIQQPDGIFSIDDAVAEEWTDDPAYDRFGLGTYLGARIDIDEELYGTVCFASSDPRGEQVTEDERQLLDLMGMWASTELRARTTQERLSEQSTQVEELARVVSHDLRNPLNIAQGQVKLLEDSIQETVQQIDTAHQRMDTIIEQMLELARVDEPVIDPPVIALLECVEEAWRLVPTDTATLAAGFEDAWIAADRDRLANLLENLFRNAVEHGGEGVTIEVGTMETGFYVADDGPGIPASERDAVFDPGYSTDSKGTGFGLSIVRRITEAHRWQVQVTDSDAGGARFEFRGIEFAPDDSPPR